MSNHLNVVTPRNLETLSESEILQYVYTPDDNSVINVKNRYIVLQHIYRVLGYQLDRFSTLALLDESPVQIFDACAGSGKTTILTVKAILEKLYRKSRLHEGSLLSGDNMLCLVYNRENVTDVKKRHADLVTKLRMSNMKGLPKIDTDLHVSTFHSFCGMWINEYKMEVGLSGYKLMKPEEQEHQMAAAIEVFNDNNSAYSIDTFFVSSFLNLYNLSRESMCSIADLVDTDTFQDIGASVSDVESIINSYIDLKQTLLQYDFTDQLVLFYQLISTNPQALERIQDCYEYIMADEVQDVTPLLLKILKLLSQRCNLICVGDEDQCIYEFRGASSQNIMNFGDVFPDHRAFVLAINRRCPEKIVRMAADLLALNVNRYDKDMRALKDEGAIQFIPYRDKTSELQDVISVLEGMTETQRNNTCVCFRNKKSGRMLVDLLSAKQHPIRYRIISAFKPFIYPLYTAVLDVLKAMYNRTNKWALLNFYKMLPITKSEMASILGIDLKTGTVIDGQLYCNPRELDLGKKAVNATFKYLWDAILTISEAMQTAPLQKYFSSVFSCILKYYWKGTSYVMNVDPEEDSDYQTFILDFFNSSLDYTVFMSQLDDKKKQVTKDSYSKTGVAISTFHALKGLEFENVIIMDMKEEIFPNFAYLEQKDISEESISSLKECETRLMHVAVTRTKKNLLVYYSKQDPSIYIDILMNSYKKSTMNSVINTPVQQESTVTPSKEFTAEPTVTKRSSLLLSRFS